MTFKRLVLGVLILPFLFVCNLHQTPLNSELSKAPKQDVDLVFQSGWAIEVTDENFGERYGYTTPVAGLTDYGNKIIYIKEDRINRALLHEIGHVLDYECGLPSQTEEFHQIYVVEKQRFVDCTSVNDRHEIVNEKEYFASVYQNIILNYEDTVRNVPRTVEFIERELNHV